MLSGKSQTEKDKCCMMPLYVESKKNKNKNLIDTEPRLVVAQPGKTDGGNQEEQTSSYKINAECAVQHGHYS